MSLIFLYLLPRSSHFFFFNDTATTEIYTLSLHDALPISPDHASSGSNRISGRRDPGWVRGTSRGSRSAPDARAADDCGRSEEHTSELQSRLHLVCRLLLEKKKKKT